MTERDIGPSGAPAEDAVLAALQAYDTATRTGDIDGQVDFFAETWRSSSGTTKADLREQLQQQADRSADDPTSGSCSMTRRWSSTETRQPSTR